MSTRLENVMDCFDAAIVPLMSAEQRYLFKAMRAQQQARESEALATKNEECAKAIESLAQALRSHYPRHDIEDAMQAVSKAYTAALVVDPLDAA